ncbi:hypothetical protein D7V97_01195 [Corallococcus sp. CA053C]|uniref:hypothetical protein n=1 Tax=Corallococcus sp. CA053C TaxID=2316732 RepID=UPI000EA3E485|nr:hypothetical protein [Corallococcus sp. CA053C]RKH15065.1 hypothetical protein D7V97_01195 [Corallococcus sp. CA053C]
MLLRRGVMLLMLWAVPALADVPPVIPREQLFGNPVRSSPALSPDGENGTSEAGSNRFRRKGA